MRQPSMAALIEILKNKKTPPTKMTWGELEDHVKKVYEFLLSLDGENVVVGRNVQLRGKTDSAYEIDVYYEFEKAGIRHRVAFECKNTKRPIDRAEVSVFKCAVDEFPGMIAVMVSAAGYQSGAKKFARDNGLLLLTLDDLPSVSQLLGMRLESVTMPDEKSVGAPFWTVFDTDTNAPYGTYQEDMLLSVLFFSKKQAQEFVEDLELKKNWVVRGMSQAHLRSFIYCVDAMDGIFTIATVCVENGCNVWGGISITREELIANYYVDPVSIPAERNVMPSLRKFSERDL